METIAPKEIRVGDVIEPWPWWERGYEPRPDPKMRVVDIVFDPHALHEFGKTHARYVVYDDAGHAVSIYPDSRVRRFERGEGPGAHPPAPPPPPRQVEWSICVQIDGGTPRKVGAVVDTVSGSKALGSFESILFTVAMWAKERPGHRVAVWAEAPFWPGLRMWETDVGQPAHSPGRDA